MFLGLFTAFGRPDIGAVVVVILFGPVIVFSWLGFKKLERRAKAYLAELARFESERQRLIAAGEEADRALTESGRSRATAHAAQPSRTAMIDMP